MVQEFDMVVIGVQVVGLSVNKVQIDFFKVIDFVQDGKYVGSVDGQSVIKLIGMQCDGGDFVE